MMRLLFCLFAILIGFAFPARALTVVELFTSQGCSTCPPADQLLAELADREDVLALSFHVTYWDKLGWKDPYAIYDATKRQRAYAAAMNDRNVFTPQMIIHGNNSVVGSRRQEVLSAISQAQAYGDPKAQIHIGGGKDGTPLSVTLTPAPYAPIYPDAPDIWLLRVTDSTQNHVEAGENRHRHLSHRHSVESIRKAGEWNGLSHSFEMENTTHPDQKIVILLQHKGPGNVIAATIYPRTRNN